MPIYDLRCQGCGSGQTDVFSKSYDETFYCEKCGKKMERTPTAFAPDTFPADGIFFENASAKGERFFSRQEIKDYAKKHDLEFDYLS